MFQGSLLLKQGQLILATAAWQQAIMNMGHMLGLVNGSSGNRQVNMNLFQGFLTGEQWSNDIGLEDGSSRIIAMRHALCKR